MNHTFRFKAKTTQPIKFLGIIQIDQENVFFTSMPPFVQTLIESLAEKSNSDNCLFKSFACNKRTS